MPDSRTESEGLSKPKSGRRAETYLPSGFLTATVRTLDYFTAGVCWQILHLMHESSERGRLLVNGRPMLEEELGRILGLPVGEQLDARNVGLLFSPMLRYIGYTVVRRNRA